MKSKAILAMLVIAATASAIWIYRNRDGNRSTQVAGALSQASFEVSANNMRSARDWEQKYGCDIECQKNPDAIQEEENVAYSMEEAQWLARQGFLSADDEAQFSKMTTHEIQQLVEKGDRKAILYVASTTDKISEITPALSRLASHDGSLAATLMLGDASHARANSLRNQAATAKSEPERKALLREADAATSNAAMDLMKASMRGDYIAAKKLSQLYPAGIPSPVFERAIRSTGADNAAYKAKYRHSLSIDPRPERALK